MRWNRIFCAVSCFFNSVMVSILAVVSLSLSFKTLIQMSTCDDSEAVVNRIEETGAARKPCVEIEASGASYRRPNTSYEARECLVC